mmetsp:Transcript_23020/g.46905  ORF Transcript_23020/g.46905 Transcript_23020/m.46905 type:complete len:196 (+) Transcript_23020:191-778(+)
MALNNSTSFLLRAASRRCASVRSARVQMQQQATSTSATATTAARSFWSTTPASVNEEEVRSLFYKWNDALATLDSGKVADRYAENALLLPTVSDTPRTTPAAIEDYFAHFLKSEPQGVIQEEGSVTISGEPNWAKDAGIYEFTMGATGDKVKGRYSFVYVFEDGEWKIAHHHSSVMPEGVLAAGAKLEAVKKAIE